MKKITIALMFFFGFLVSGFAQTDSSKMTKKMMSKTSVTKSTGMNKDGSPDMRMKSNKEVKSKADAAKMSAATSTDKVVGKDAKGNTIYEGSQGGKYVMNKNGNKEYLKSAK